MVAVLLLNASVRAASPAEKMTPKKTHPRGTVVFRVAGVLSKSGKKDKSGKIKRRGRLMPAYVQTTVKPGDVVRTDARSRAEIHLGDGVIIRLKENSVIKLSGFEATKKVQKVSLRALAGEILLKISKNVGVQRRVKVWTPTAVAAVRGTVFIVDVTKPAETDIRVLQGTVRASSVSSAGAEEAGGRDVVAGKEVAAVQGQPLSEPAAMSSEEAAEGADWLGEPEMEAASGQEDDAEAGEEESEAAEPEAPETVEPEAPDSTTPQIEESEPGESSGDSDE